MRYVHKRKEKVRSAALSVPTCSVKNSTTTTAMKIAKGCACKVRWRGMWTVD